MVEITEKNAVAVAKAVKAGEVPGPAKSLAEAMNRVMEQVGYIQKKGTVTVGQGYKFAGEAQFIEALRPELVAQGIVVTPVDMQPLFCEQFQGKSGPQNRVVLRVTYRFTHVGSGQSLDVVTCGEGIDSGDKATNKAQTGAMKYALRQAFVIETGNDPDETPSAFQERQAGASKYAREIVAKLDAAKSRNDGVPLWKQYDADCKANHVSEADRRELDAAFRLFGERFPAPAKA